MTLKPRLHTMDVKVKFEITFLVLCSFGMIDY